MVSLKQRYRKSLQSALKLGILARPNCCQYPLPKLEQLPSDTGIPLRRLKKRIACPTLPFLKSACLYRGIY
jgi:hypothetical protein